MPEPLNKVGYAGLLERHGLPAVPHHCVSFIHGRSDRRTVVTPTVTEQYFQPRYDPGEGLGGQLEFALKYEGVNLCALRLLFEAVGDEQLAAVIRAKPTGKYTRRLWFLYEFLLDRRLPLDDLAKGRYVDLLDASECLTGPAENSRRHMVVNNLPGNRDFCPLIRRTTALTDFIEARLDECCLQVLRGYPESLLQRALGCLFTKETKSSFAIERATSSQRRANRFVELLKRAGRDDYLTKAALVGLQHATVDARFANDDYRTTQNYVGESVRPDLERVHFIAPKPQDVASLMAGLLAAARRMEAGGLHPVAAAAAVAFGFVFVHPFDDGNGRIHRFLIHHFLAKTGFTPAGVIFPVSATMLKKMPEYDRTLELFSKPLMELVEYDMDSRGEVTVQNDTAVYYRYPDMTGIAESLFAFIRETVDTEFTAELDFLTQYDEAKRAIQDVADMPDRLVDLFIRFATQNRGKLSKSKRERYFAELTDTEVDRMTALVRDAFAG